jgi:signal transduction histidine kinase
MLAFPHIFVSAQGHHEVRDGDFFSLPPELSDGYRIGRYLAISTLGWSKTELGYMALVREDDFGNRYILPGLYLKDSPTPNRKFHGYRPIFSKSQVEKYLSKHLAWEAEIRRKSEHELTSLVHDLRHLSSSIYHSAIEAETANRANDKAKTAEGIKTIIASQTMLKVRIDYLDFSNSVPRFDDFDEIPVYSRVDKVIRCFRASAKHNTIILTGTSYRLAYGPNILDIAPYTLIENAIKYAPKNTNIYVDVKDTNSDTVVSVNSVGPKLKESEVNKIFSRGFRGSNAIMARSSGTGLGLSVAKSVIELFKGRIEVIQDPQSELRNGITYGKITFSFRIPTSGEDSFRKSKSTRGKARRSFSSASS